MNITARLAASQAEEEKEQGSDKDIKMSGVEFASIQPGDLSPGVMNVNHEAVVDGTTESAAATSTAPSEEENKTASVGDRRT